MSAINAGMVHPLFKAELAVNFILHHILQGLWEFATLKLDSSYFASYPILLSVALVYLFSNISQHIHIFKFIV